jgi:Phage integrase central domain
MSDPVRVKVEPCIWQRGGVYEITFRDAQGKQRRRTVEGGITAARNTLAKEVAKRANGERITADPRLRFGQAADAWLVGPVTTLRPNTISTYKGAVDGHLRPRIGQRRMDDLTPDDIARVVAEMRAAGYSEWTISTTLMVCGQVFRHAARRMGWRGQSPTMLLERGERPHVSATAKRRIFRGDELRERSRRPASRTRRCSRPQRSRPGESPRCSRSCGARLISGTSPRSASRIRLTGRAVACRSRPTRRTTVT